MDSTIKQQIQEEAARVFPIVQIIRRHIHQHPELSFEEIKTSQYIARKLSQFGIEFTAGWVETGIRAVIKGKGKGKTIALRGDMDALPILETNETDYTSVNAGIMHACGHDVHTACVIGTAIILQKLSDLWSGEVVLIFQPGEEKLPGGARLMLEAGIFDDVHPTSVLAQHVFPSLPAGKVGFRAGKYMASTDELYITVRGKGGHGAMPHQVHDPIVASAQIILSLQQVCSRLAAPGTPTVLSIGKVIANGATNVIPDEVKLEGTFRTMDENWRMRAHEHIHRICTETAHAFGVKAEVDIRKGYPVLNNNEPLTERCILAAREYLGDENVTLLEKRMTAEDFAWIAQEYPACFYRLGTAGENGAFTAGVHTSNFDINEQALITGVGLMTWLTLKELESN
jgi:amidohydrolase